MYSNYFKELYNSVGELNPSSAMKEIELDDTDPISFYQILYYCYKGVLPNQKLYNMYDWLALLMTSTKYSFTIIINYCEYKIKKYISLKTINEIDEYAEVLFFFFFFFFFFFDIHNY